MNDASILFPEPFDSALVTFREGRRAEAAERCRDILKATPTHADARHLLGVIHHLDGDPITAEAFIRAALCIATDVEKETDLGMTLKAQTRYAEAQAALHRALTLDPNFALAYYRLAGLYDMQGHVADAESAYRGAIECKPDDAAYHFDFGKFLAVNGKPSEALDRLRRALELRPDWPEALNSLGIVLVDLKRFDEAEQAFRRALVSNPDFIVALTSLGNLLMDTGRSNEAEAPLKRALELNPDNPETAYNLSVLFFKTERLDDSEALARAIIARNPDSAINYSGLGNTLLAKGSGDISEALDCLRRSIALDPTNIVAHANLSYALTFASVDGYDVLAECRRFASRFEAPFASSRTRYENDPTPTRRLRIGYVSPDFRFHCQAIFMLPLLRNHDHDVVEVYCYSTAREPDDITRRHTQFADHWRDVHLLDDEQLARLIREDRIDVLVDLTMHMSNARRLVFARRPAPVQIAWLAYPGTTGSDAIDYRLTDPWLDPVEASHLDDRYSERSIRLPDTFWCYEPLVEGLEVGALPMDSAGRVTFGCLNNPCKLTDRMFALWARVMRDIERSRLLLMVSPGDARSRVRDKFAALGIEAERIEFVEFQPPAEYMRTYDRIDIVLDTFPYNGHTTSLDALWMGAPVVTLFGNTAVSRAGYSLLSNLDLAELAADSEDGFVRSAIELASDRMRLEELRRGLRERMMRSPLTDGARFAVGVEEAFRYAWRDYCGGVHRSN